MRDVDAHHAFRSQPEDARVALRLAPDRPTLSVGSTLELGVAGRLRAAALVSTVLAVDAFGGHHTVVGALGSWSGSWGSGSWSGSWRGSWSGFCRNHSPVDSAVAAGCTGRAIALLAVERHPPAVDQGVAISLAGLRVDLCSNSTLATALR